MWCNNRLRAKLGTAGWVMRIACCVALLAPAPALLAAADERGVHVYVLGEARYDDNLLLLDTEEVSDTRFRLGVGLEGNLQLGRQAVRFDGVFHRSQFDELDLLDYNGGAIDVHWDWVASDRFSGQINLGAERDLAGFDEFSSLAKDLIDRRNASLSAGYNVTGRFRVEGEVGYNSRQHSFDAREQADEKVNEIEAALLYRTPKGTWLGVIASRLDGRFPNRILLPAGISDTGYEQFRYGGTVRWNVSVKTELRLDVGFTRRQQDNFRQRNYTDPWWSFEVNWQATPNTMLRLSTWQDIRSIDNPDSSFATERAFSLESEFGLTARSKARVELTYRELDFSNNVGTPLVDRENDDLRLMSVIEFKPLRNLILELGAQYELRDATIPELEYESARVFAGFRLQF